MKKNKKNIYVSPKMEMMDMDMKCDILDVSSSGTLPGTGQGGTSEGDMDADANERVEWGNLW